jgi:hypothetical protein
VRPVSTRFRVAQLYGGPSLAEPVGNPVQTFDEAARGRLRAAIVAEDGDEEQLDGVLRMLGAEIPVATQVPLFGKAPASQAQKP